MIGMFVKKFCNWKFYSLFKVKCSRNELKVDVLFLYNVCVCPIYTANAQCAGPDPTGASFCSVWTPRQCHMIQLSGYLRLTTTITEETY